MSGIDNRILDLIDRIASEILDAKMEDKIEKFASGFIPEVIRRTIDEVLDEMDLGHEILIKAHSIDIQELTREEVKKTIAKIIKGQISELIEKEVRYLLRSDEMRLTIESAILLTVKDSLATPEMRTKLDELAQEGLSESLQRLTMSFFQKIAPRALE